jgi:hypothetical protein
VRSAELPDVRFHPRANEPIISLQSKTCRILTDALENLRIFDGGEQPPVRHLSQFTRRMSFPSRMV